MISLFLFNNQFRLIEQTRRFMISKIFVGTVFLASLAATTMATAHPHPIFFGIQVQCKTKDGSPSARFLFDYRNDLASIADDEWLPIGNLISCTNTQDNSLICTHSSENGPSSWSYSLIRHPDKKVTYKTTQCSFANCKTTTTQDCESTFEYPPSDLTHS